MADISGRGIHKKPASKTSTKSKKKELPANSLKTLAGGWNQKEADELLESLEFFDQASKICKK